MVGCNAINGLFANGQLNGAPTNDTGIAITGGGPGVIAGNSLESLYVGIYTGPGVSLVNVGANSRVAMTAYINDSGSGCKRASEVPLETSYK